MVNQVFRLSRAGWASLVVACAVGLAAAAIAAPRVTVRARTSIELDPIRRIPGGIVVSGQVADRASGEGVPFAPVRIEVDGEIAELVTGEDGVFEASFPLATGSHDLAVDYSGDTYYSADRTELAGFDVAKRPLTLTVRADDRVSSVEGAIPVAILSRSEDQPVPLRIELFAGDTSQEELRRVGAVATDAAGRASTTLEREALGGPGRKRIEARFPGDEAFDQAVASATFLVTSSTAVTFALEEELVKYEDSLRGAGRLQDRFGTGIGGAPVALVSGSDVLRESVTDADGGFVLSVPAAELGPGPVNVQAVFDSDRPWLEGSRSELSVAHIAERQPVPVGYTMAAFGVTCMALLAFVGLRTRPWEKWLARLRRSEDVEDPQATEAPEKPLHTGLAPARPSLVSTLRRAHDFGFSGTVRNAVSGKPVAAASVRVVHPEHGEQAAEVGADGRFELERLAEGAWSAEIGAPGFCTERFTVSLPHRGELRGARVDLLPVREKIFALYRRAAVPLLPKSRLWGIWTPRQIVDHVRGRRPAPALADLTDYVEEAYFSQREPQEQDLASARDLVRAAQSESHE